MKVSVPINSCKQYYTVLLSHFCKKKKKKKRKLTVPNLLVHLIVYP